MRSERSVNAVHLSSAFGFGNDLFGMTRFLLFGMLKNIMILPFRCSGISLLTVAPVAAFSIVYGKRLRNYSKQLQEQVASSTQLAEEKISNIRTVRSFGQVRASSRKGKVKKKMRLTLRLMISIAYSMGTKMDVYLINDHSPRPGNSGNFQLPTAK